VVRRLQGDFWGRSLLKPWVAAITLRVASDYRRQMRRKGSAEPLEDSVEDPAPGPHERAEGRSELAAVMARLQRLPEMDRSALIMRAVDELPYEEIALALGISPTSARVKVHRARLKLEEVREL